MPPTSNTDGAGSRKSLARRSITTVVGVAVIGCLGVSASSAGPFTQAGHDFVTRPDLVPPETNVTTPAHRTTEGDILRTPIAPLNSGVGGMLESPPQGGALITNDAGEPVWFKPTNKAMTDLQMQEYKGEKVLTWWEGELVVPPGMGFGEAVIMDQSYQEVTRVKMGNGVKADIHDFQITPKNTALMLAYDEVEADLSSVGGPKDGKVLEGVVQEVDIETGEVLFDWRSLDHIGLDESHLPLPEDPSQAWDYIHLNSAEADGDGLLISARSTHAVYRLNRENGEVDWRLNGKKSDFEMGEGSPFEWQHDARRLPDGTISIFDNAIPEKIRSRGVVIDADPKTKTAEVVRENWRPEEIVSPNMANYQVMDNGSSFVGWGGGDGMHEFGPDKSVRYAAEFEGEVQSYRAYRADWEGTPTEPPAVVANRSGSTMSAHVSWNGATEVAGWRVLAGDAPENMQPVTDAKKDGFETRIDLPEAKPHLKVQALDDMGAVIGESQPVAVK